ncbi:MAG: fatty acid--CoA ligase family protein [Acholeplasma sp.]|nr:fatty acid--CoA ligase family protein [Acholeplasma sp.]
MNWLIESFVNYEEEIAVIFQDISYSYKHLYNKIKEYYNLIKDKIPKGSNEIVAIVSDYSFESIALFFALVENKNTVVPITSKIQIEIDERIAISGCNYLLYINNQGVDIRANEKTYVPHPLISELHAKNSSGLILFSSGSTGKPKAMIHDLDNLIDTYKDKKGKKLVFLIFLMFDHIGGLNTLLNCLSMGVTMVFPTYRDPEHVSSLIEKYKVNVLPASPTFLNLLIISESFKKHDLSSLRLITYGTEAMQESLLLKLKDVFPKARFLQTFGTSETGISKMSSKSSTSTLIKFDDPNAEYKIVDGELWIKSKTQILGYLNSSMERFTNDGWFKTGDLVEESEDGYLKIIGRNSEIINVGGEKVLPAEVESVLLQMPEVMDCIVYGETNPITGQMVVAKILFNSIFKVAEAKKIVTSYCIDKLSRYKIPAKVILMKESEYTDRYKKKRN